MVSRIGSVTRVRVVTPVVPVTSRAPKKIEGDGKSFRQVLAEAIECQARGKPARS